MTILESDCCYAPVVAGDICTRCKEHCDPVWVETEEELKRLWRRLKLEF